MALLQPLQCPPKYYATREHGVILHHTALPGPLVTPLVTLKRGSSRDTVVMNNYLTQADNAYQGLTPTWPVVQEFVDEDYTDAELRTAAHNNTHKEKDMATSQRQLELRRARLERELDRAEAELERLESLPEEPAVDSVVSFEKVFEKNGRRYSWVAYHAVQGSWYLSQDGPYGARQPKMTWFDLLEFIGSDNTIYLATEWEVLS